MKQEPLLHTCHYCSRRCQVGKMYGLEISWGCTHCRATFRVTRNSKLVVTELWTLHRKKKYTFILPTEPNYPATVLLDNERKEIRAFEKINITPENIDSKLQTILTFL